MYAMVPTALPGLVSKNSSVAVGICDTPTVEPAGANFRQTEIENFSVAQLGHKKICWLDVAMNDSFGVRSIERVSNFGPERKQCPVSWGDWQCGVSTSRLPETPSQ